MASSTSLRDPGANHVRPFMPPAVLGAALFTALYMLAAGLTAAAKGNTEFAFYAIVMLIIIAALLWLHWRVRLSSGVIWGLALWGALHMAGGLMPVPAHLAQGEGPAVLYSLWLSPMGEQLGLLKYDKAVHAFGFAVTTWLCWQALLGAVGLRRPTFGLMVLCVAAAMGFGALNEVIEFLATRLTETNVGGYYNTSLDLVANLLGAVLAAAMICLMPQRDTTGKGRE